MQLQLSSSLPPRRPICSIFTSSRYQASSFLLTGKQNKRTKPISWCRSSTSPAARPTPCLPSTTISRTLWAAMMSSCLRARSRSPPPCLLASRRLIIISFYAYASWLRSRELISTFCPSSLIEPNLVLTHGRLSFLPFFSTLLQSFLFRYRWNVRGLLRLRLQSQRHWARCRLVQITRVASRLRCYHSYSY